MLAIMETNLPEVWAQIKLKENPPPKPKPVPPKAPKPSPKPAPKAAVKPAPAVKLEK